MTINNDIQNYYLDNNVNNNNVLEKVASGLEINKASDNASGLAIADQLLGQNAAISQAIENVNSGVALTNIANSGLNEQKNILQNIRQEIIKANNGTLNQSDREIIENQISNYVEQFNAIAEQTNYNGKSLLETSGDLVEDDLTISTEDSQIGLSSVDTKSIANDINSFISQFSSSQEVRDNLLQAIDEGINKLDDFQGNFASTSNQLESSARNYLDQQVNISNAQSEIRDLDYASIVETFSKADIQSQIGSFIQSQANANNARTLSLLR
jgi:flagellin